MKKRIALLYGGRSGEHDVSRVSAASVAKNLDEGKYDVTLIGITMEGVWYLQGPEELRRCREGAASLEIAEAEERRVAVLPGLGPGGALRLAGDSRAIPRDLPVDIVFPVLHGTFGEDGTVQGLLEMARLPYVGCGLLGSAAGMDKDIAKSLWAQAGLPTTGHVLIRSADRKNQEKWPALLAEAEQKFSYPLFVKPSCAGSSVGTGMAENRAALERAVAAALDWDDKVLIEPFIPAREIECSVMGNDVLSVYSPGEVIPSHQFYDYDAKYTDPNGAVLVAPARLEEGQARRIQDLALRAYRAAEISGLARIDFFIRKDTGEILLNEANTMPGFTPISMFPRMCEVSGLAYGAMLERLIALGEERFTAREARSYRRT